MKKTVLSMIAILVWGFNSPAQERVYENLDTYLTALTEQDKFTGVVLVHKDDENVFHNTYSFADRSNETPMTTAHAFRIGSVAKSFTATLIAMEIDRGILGAEMTVDQFIPDFPRGKEISLTHLLSHTSGIVNYFAMLDEELYQPHSPMDLINYSRDHDLLFEPGEGWDYSNTNYAILGYILEQLHEKPYGQILREQIFEPCGMTSSGIEDSEIEIVAKGYSINSQGELDTVALVHQSVSYAAGNILSTTEDMLRFSKALINGELIRPETLKKFTTPIRNGYALGFMSHHNHDHVYIGHNGGNPGFQANWKYFPDHDMHVVILCNSFTAPFGDIVATIADILFDQPFEIPAAISEIELSSAQMMPFIGSYRVSDDMTFEVKLRNDQLTFQATGQDAFPIWPFNDHSFFIKGTDITVVFVKDERDNVMALEWTQSGQTSTFDRIQSDDSMKKVLKN